MERVAKNSPVSAIRQISKVFLICIKYRHLHSHLCFRHPMLTCSLSSVSHAGASMSSASSDTGMSPSSSSPPQNVLAVECRWYTLLCLASSLLPWTSILTFSHRKHSTGLTLPSISCTHFHCWTVSVLPSFPLFCCCCFVLFLSYRSEKLSSLKVCRHNVTCLSSCLFLFCFC